MGQGRKHRGSSPGYVVAVELICGSEGVPDERLNSREGARTLGHAQEW